MNEQELADYLWSVGYRVRLESHNDRTFSASLWFKQDPITYRPRVSTYGDTMLEALDNARTEVAGYI